MDGATVRSGPMPGLANASSYLLVPPKPRFKVVRNPPNLHKGQAVMTSPEFKRVDLPVSESDVALPPITARPDEEEEGETSVMAQMDVELSVERPPCSMAEDEAPPAPSVQHAGPSSQPTFAPRREEGPRGGVGGPFHSGGPRGDPRDRAPPQVEPRGTFPAARYPDRQFGNNRIPPQHANNQWPQSVPPRGNVSRSPPRQFPRPSGANSNIGSGFHPGSRPRSRPQPQQPRFDNRPSGGPPMPRGGFNQMNDDEMRGPARPVRNDAPVTMRGGINAPLPPRGYGGPGARVEGDLKRPGPQFMPTDMTNKRQRSVPRPHQVPVMQQNRGPVPPFGRRRSPPRQ